MKRKLTIDDLIMEARNFCVFMSQERHLNLSGVTDGKAVGTYVEHRLQQYLLDNYIVTIGNSAKGIDLPDKNILTDIKVTSCNQPQSSCPFKNARQKVYGLGYNLLVLVYMKDDSNLKFLHCTFIDKKRTADFTTTKYIRDMLSYGANKDDIIGFLMDRNIPGDEIVYDNLADEILSSCPEQGYLTISNALQWRLQYSHAILLNNKVSGVVNYDW